METNARHPGFLEGLHVVGPDNSHTPCISGFLFKKIVFFINNSMLTHTCELVFDTFLLKFFGRTVVDQSLRMVVPGGLFVRARDCGYEVVEVRLLE